MIDLCAYEFSFKNQYLQMIWVRLILLFYWITSSNMRTFGPFNPADGFSWNAYPWNSIADVFTMTGVSVLFFYLIKLNPEWLF